MTARHTIGYNESDYPWSRKEDFADVIFKYHAMEWTGCSGRQCAALREMKKALKWLGVAIGGSVGLILLAVAAVYAISTFRFNRTYEVQVAPVAIPTDPESIAYGEHIANIRGCKGCHGEDLSREYGNR